MNTKLLTTGFDLKDYDTVFMADRMLSYIMILRAVARAARRAEGKGKGCVIIPIQAPGGFDRKDDKLVEAVTTFVAIDERRINTAA